jgi:HlyD family secretion protein
MQSNVFRKVALERISSPEQLDQVMQTTAPRGWIALSAAGLLLAAALAWGVLGVLPDKVIGSGILVKTGGVLEVVAPAGGRVVDVAVRVGEQVREGQVVAWMEQPELLARVQQARMQLDDHRRRHAQGTANSGAEARIEAQSLAEQKANLRQSIAALETSLRYLGERVEAQEKLVEQGLITRATLLATQQQLDQTREKVRASRAELVQLDERTLTTGHQRSVALDTQRQEVQAAAATLAQLERDLEAATQVTSSYTGRVLEVMTQQGKMLGVGEPVVSLDRSGRSVQDLVAVVYVPSVQGKRVRPGMKIEIAPSTVRREEYGMMLGTVTFVSDYPATSRGMMQTLKNDQLVEALSGGGAPYEVHAALTVDPNTASRYRWTSSEGPPVRVHSGTLAAGQVIVETQRPIAKVIPLLRRWTGI